MDLIVIGGGAAVISNLSGNNGEHLWVDCVDKNQDCSCDVCSAGIHFIQGERYGGQVAHDAVCDNCGADLGFYDENADNQAWFDTLKDLAGEMGFAREVADRVIFMDKGEIISDNSPKNTGKVLKELNHDMYKALPTPMRVHGEVVNNLPTPLTVREGRIWLEDFSKENVLNFTVKGVGQMLPKELKKLIFESK